MPTLVTELGMVMEIKSAQFLNADSPILVTVLGIVTEVKPLQPQNALWPMLVTFRVAPLIVAIAGMLTTPE